MIQIGTVKSILLIKMFLGLLEMTFGLVYSNFSLPEWQALKVTIFVPCGFTLFRMNWAMCLKYLLLDKCMVQDTTCSKDNLDQSSNFYNLMKKNINFQIKNPSLILGK